jgi:hypothetical protein
MTRLAIRAAITVLALLTGPSVLAQNNLPPAEMAKAPAEPDAIPLYGANAPGSASSETWMTYGQFGYVVRNVTRPTLTPFLPDPKKATGAAVIVAPGGAFMLLAIEPEGWKVAQVPGDANPGGYRRGQCAHEQARGRRAS